MIVHEELIEPQPLISLEKKTLEIENKIISRKKSQHKIIIYFRNWNWVYTAKVYCTTLDIHCYFNWWKLFQKHFVHTKVDIYVFIKAENVFCFHIPLHLMKLSDIDWYMEVYLNTYVRRMSIEKIFMSWVWDLSVRKELKSLFNIKKNINDFKW